MKKIIIDTNFLMIPYKFKVDIFQEFHRICNFAYKLYIYERSIEELKKIIEKQSGANRKAAQIALKLIKLKNISIVSSNHGRDVDALIMSNLDNDTVIATQDSEVKKKLLGKGASVITLRQKKYLQFVKNHSYR